MLAVSCGMSTGTLILVALGICYRLSVVSHIGTDVEQRWTCAASWVPTVDQLDNVRADHLRDERRRHHAP